MKYCAKHIHLRKLRLQTLRKLPGQDFEDNWQKQIPFMSLHSWNAPGTILKELKIVSEIIKIN